MLTLSDVRKTYGRRPVLHVPEFSLHASDTVGLLGDNGSGKSTLLRVLAGITRHTSGRIHRSKRWRRARIAVVPQSGGINPDLTVAENLRMYRRLYGRDSKATLSERPLVRDFALTEFLEERAGNLSGGYQRIVSIVGSLDVEPDGLLLDEPLSGLDREHTARVLGVLAGLAPDLLFLVITGHDSSDLPLAARHVTLVQGTPQ